MSRLTMASVLYIPDRRKANYVALTCSVFALMCIIYLIRTYYIALLFCVNIVCVQVYTIFGLPTVIISFMQKALHDPRL